MAAGVRAEAGNGLSLRRASRERDILASAKKRFTEQGFESTAVAEIASDVGVVEGTIYTYFESKRALLHRLIAEFYEPLIAEVERSIPGIVGVRNQLRYLAWRQLRAFAEEPEICYLIIRELQPAAHAYDSIVVGLARRYTSIAVDVLEKAIERGDVRRGVSPYLVRAILYGSVENVAWRLTFRKKPVDLEALADEIADILCFGMTKPPAQGELPAAIASLESLVEKLKQVSARTDPQERTKRRKK